jgi:hypothetical protein
MMLKWRRTLPPRLIGNAVDSILALRCVPDPFFVASWKHASYVVFVSSRQFETLDLTFQEEFEKFLQERGVNESLAFFVPEYAQHKEQKVENSTVLSYALMADDLRVIIGICQLARKSQELR